LLLLVLPFKSCIGFTASRLVLWLAGVVCFSQPYSDIVVNANLLVSEITYAKKSRTLKRNNQTKISWENSGTFYYFKAY